MNDEAPSEARSPVDQNDLEVGLQTTPRDENIPTVIPANYNAD